jgi:hypothetical protein
MRTLLNHHGSEPGRPLYRLGMIAKIVCWTLQSSE